MARGAIVNYVEGDEARLRCQLADQDLSTLTFRARLRRSDLVLIERTGQVESVGGDWFFFDWLPGDLVPGLHRLDIVITDSDGNQRSYPSDGPVSVLVRPAA